MEHETVETVHEVAHHEALHHDPAFWVAMGFVLFFVLFGRQLFRFLLSGLDNRAKRIRSELDEARRLRDEAEATYNAYRRKYEESVKEAEAILAQARSSAQALIAQTQEELQALIVARTRIAEEKIGQMETQVIDEVRQHLAQITLEATKTLIIENLDQISNDTLISTAIHDIGHKVH